jgi:hypothetical protein
VRHRHESDHRPDYDRIAQLEIECQTGPAWDAEVKRRDQEMERRARETEAAMAEVDAEQAEADKLKSLMESGNNEQFYREIAFETWRRQEPGLIQNRGWWR